MGKKRSRGITLWGWLFIIVGILLLLEMIIPQLRNPFSGIGMILFDAFIGGAYLIRGIADGRTQNTYERHCEKHK